jgi:prepilin-type N-terminal cleavage/methylation domain-containing protein
LKPEHENGFTVLEVLVAVFIFSCVTAALLKATGSADRIRSRSSIVLNARLLAENEFGRISNIASKQETINDSNYTATVNGKEFEVQRHILVPEQFLWGSVSQDRSTSLVEIELVIKAKSSLQKPVRFRMIQGYSW